MTNSFSLGILTLASIVKIGMAVIYNSVSFFMQILLSPYTRLLYWIHFTTGLHLWRHAVAVYTAERNCSLHILQQVYTCGQNKNNLSAENTATAAFGKIDL